MKRVPGREDAEVYSHQRQIDDYAVERTRLFPTPFGSFTPLDLPGGGSPLFVSAHCQHGNPWNQDTLEVMEHHARVGEVSPELGDERGDGRSSARTEEE